MMHTNTDEGTQGVTAVDTAGQAVPAATASHVDPEIAALAPYFCSKNHPLVDVAWEGQFRRGTCQCGRVLAWSGKGYE